MTKAQLAREHCNKPPHFIKQNTLYNRLCKGMSLDEALNIPGGMARKIPMSHPYKSKCYETVAKRKGRKHD